MSVPSFLRQTFLAGLLTLLPLYITWVVLAIVFEMVDKPLGGRINDLISAATGTDVHVPGLGIICTVAIVLIIGLVTRVVFVRRIFEAIDKLIDRVPLVRSLYNASRQIVVPFTDKHALPFSEVVLVEYPMPGRYTLGFVAKQKLSDLDGDDRIVVFFPSNHLHLGYPVVMSRKDVQTIDMTIEEAIKFMVSCGVVGEENLIRHRGELLTIGSRHLELHGSPARAQQA